MILGLYIMTSHSDTQRGGVPSPLTVYIIAYFSRINKAIFAVICPIIAVMGFTFCIGAGSFYYNPIAFLAWGKIAYLRVFIFVSGSYKQKLYCTSPSAFQVSEGRQDKPLLKRILMHFRGVYITTVQIQFPEVSEHRNYRTFRKTFSGAGVCFAE